MEEPAWMQSTATSASALRDGKAHTAAKIEMNANPIHATTEANAQT